MKKAFMKGAVIRTAVILFCVSLFASSCSKYDDGPVFSLYAKDKRVQGKWYFSVVKYNDVDSTDAYRYDPVQTLEFFLKRKSEEEWNGYTWSHGYGVSARIDYGFWRFNEEMDSLKMVTTVSILPSGEANLDTVYYDWKIDRLAYTDFWLTRQADESTEVIWKLFKLAY